MTGKPKFGKKAFAAVECQTDLTGEGGGGTAAGGGGGGGGGGKGKRSVDPGAQLNANLAKSRALCPLGKLLSSGSESPKLSVEQCLDVMSEVWEKKCEADAADRKALNTPDSLVEFIEEHFLHK